MRLERILSRLQRDALPIGAIPPLKLVPVDGVEPPESLDRKSTVFPATSTV